MLLFGLEWLFFGREFRKVMVCFRLVLLFVSDVGVVLGFLVVCVCFFYWGGCLLVLRVVGLWGCFVLFWKIMASICWKL